MYMVVFCHRIHCWTIFQLFVLFFAVYIDCRKQQRRQLRKAIQGKHTKTKSNHTNHVWGQRTPPTKHPYALVIWGTALALIASKVARVDPDVKVIPCLFFGDSMCPQLTQLAERCVDSPSPRVWVLSSSRCHAQFVHGKQNKKQFELSQVRSNFQSTHDFDNEQMQRNLATTSTRINGQTHMCLFMTGACRYCLQLYLFFVIPHITKSVNVGRCKKPRMRAFKITKYYSSDSSTCRT